MDPRLSLVTLACSDLSASRAFYVDGLGWAPEVEVPGEVVMVRVADKVVLSLWDRAAFECEVGTVATGVGLAPVALAHNVGSREEVDAVLAQAGRAGARVRPASDRAWGGYTGYFHDPEGFAWEVAWNPGTFGSSLL
jgi:catechol 2,3-dioxygenase-like lactoylglutathione lyase family enzyme